MALFRSVTLPMLTPAIFNLEAQHYSTFQSFTSRVSLPPTAGRWTPDDLLRAPSTARPSRNSRWDMPGAGVVPFLIILALTLLVAAASGGSIMKGGALMQGGGSRRRWLILVLLGRGAPVSYPLL